MRYVVLYRFYCFIYDLVFSTFHAYAFYSIPLICHERNSRYVFSTRWFCNYVHTEYLKAPKEGGKSPTCRVVGSTNLGRSRRVTSLRQLRGPKNEWENWVANMLRSVYEPVDNAMPGCALRNAGGYKMIRELS